MTTVKELIEHLKTFDENLPVCYQCYSEHTVLELEHVKEKELPKPRSDGWIHSDNYRRVYPLKDGEKDREIIKYVEFPGN